MSQVAIIVDYRYPAWADATISWSRPVSRPAVPRITLIGVPVAGGRKTTIRPFTVRVRRKTKVFAHTYGGRKSLILPTFTVVFCPGTGFSSPPQRFGSCAPQQPGKSFKEANKYKHIPPAQPLPPCVCISPLPASAGQPLPAQAPVPRPVLPESCGAGKSRAAEKAI
jgi:hypothetical protein